MTKEEAEALIGKRVVLHCLDGQGGEHSMAGLVVRVKDGYIEVDYGYGVRYEVVTRYEVK